MGGRVFREKKTSEALRVISFVATAVVLIILAVVGIGNLGSAQEQKQLEIAQDAVVRAAVQCYALESRFPSSLQYLVDNYGLSLDESKYIYFYKADGSNFLPRIEIFPIDAAEGSR